MDRAPANLQLSVIAAAVLLVAGGIAWFGMGSDEAAPSASVPDVEGRFDQGTASHLSIHVSGGVADPGVVAVPAGSRVADVVRAAGGATTDADLAAVNLAAEVRDGEHVAIPVRGDPPVRTSNVDGIDLNAADSTRMQELPGVGPVLAGRIVQFREEHGPFETVEDLLDVPGIGEAKLEGMRDAIAAP